MTQVGTAECEKEKKIQLQALSSRCPFPEVGPLTMTTDADVFKGLIEELTASGGGDIPELSLSGLQVLSSQSSDRPIL